MVCSFCFHLASMTPRILLLYIYTCSESVPIIRMYIASNCGLVSHATIPVVATFLLLKWSAVLITMSIHTVCRPLGTAMCPMCVISGVGVDVNECQDNNGDCQHDCVNTPGSFYCSCHDGYRLQGSNNTCRGRWVACV